MKDCLLPLHVCVFLYEKKCFLSLQPLSLRCSTLNKTLEDLAAEGDDADFETEHESRRRRLAAADPVHNLDLRGFFEMRMREMAARLGQHG